MPENTIGQTAVNLVDRAFVPGTISDWRDAFGRNRTSQDRWRGAASIGLGLLGRMGPLGGIAGRLGRNLLRNNVTLSYPAAWDRLSRVEREALEGMGITNAEQWQAYQEQQSANPHGFNNHPNTPMMPTFQNPTEQPSLNPTVTVGDINTGFGPVMPTIDQNTGQVYNNSFPGVTGPYTHTPQTSTGTGWQGIVMPYLQPSDEPNTSGLPGITSPLAGSGYGPSEGSGNTGWVSTAGNYGAGVGAYGTFHGVAGNSPSQSNYQSGVSPYFSPYIEY